MSYRIVNRSAGPVLLRLRSGRTIHLRAGGDAPDLEGAEILGNPRVASLVERRLIAVEEVDEAVPRRKPVSRKRSGTAAEGGPR